MAEPPFASLTPERMLSGLEAVGLRPDGRLLALNSYENRVYQVGLDGAEPVVAKFYRPGRWSLPTILEEHEFAFELTAAEIPVVAPIELGGRTLFECQGFHYCIYPRRGGRWPELDGFPRTAPGWGVSSRASTSSGRVDGSCTGPRCRGRRSGGIPRASCFLPGGGAPERPTRRARRACGRARTAPLGAPVTRARPDDLLVFLGPSLPAAEARRITPCRLLPPARAGDLFAVLPLRPLAIALLDGVFELVPSVWHREILAALDAGIAVFGGASMGALRAAELSAFGMVGVGGIFRAYRDGELSDDSEVALLHAGPEHGHRPFTLPLVTVRAAARAARRARRITGAEARAVVDAAERIFWQERSWSAVLDRSRLGARARGRAWGCRCCARSPST